MENQIVKREFTPIFKKTFSLLLSLVMLFSITAGIDLSAFAATSGDYEYTVKNGTASITGYNGSETDILIPSEIDGYTVTSIGNKAFYDCRSLKSVIIPDGVTTIGYDAFYKCLCLTSIDISDSVMSIGSNAFALCESLSTIKLSNNVESIGSNAFSYCKSLMSIIIPDSVTSISSFLFQHCENLSNVEMSNNITSIAASAFLSCKSLTNIRIPDSVTSIGDGAFTDCSKIKNISIPYGVQYINNYTFNGCDMLKSVTIPNSIIQITSYAFKSCNNLSDVYYDGTMNEWNNIDISGNNIQLIASTIFCLDGVINCKHSYNVVTKPETCTEDGKLMYICEFCNDTYTEALLATGHSYDSGKVTKIATCTVNGTKTYTCTKCNATKSETIKATGHKAVTDKAVAATCTTAGKTASSHCSVCNTVITAQKTVPATGHSYDAGKVTKIATCTANGVKIYTCTKCKVTKTETVKATGHKAITDKVVAATCTTAGKTAGSHCSVCNAVITVQKVIPATGHGYDAGKITKQPTATTAGVKTYTCIKCKATKTEAIPATGLKAPVLKAAVNANGTFKLSWNKVTGADKYELYIKQADGSYKLMKTTTGTSFITAFATYGKQFTYKMRAVTGNVKSAYSAAVNATNTKKLQTPTMKVTVNANGTFKLSWNKVTGADKYELYIKQADGSYKLMKTTTATSFTTAFATYGKQFSYKMRAVNSKNKSVASAYSSVVNAKNTKKLQTPTLKATVNKNGSFKLSWGKVTGATSYQIYMKQSNGTYKLIKTTSSTSFTTAVASKGKTYSYKIRAVTSKNKNATSAYSKVVSAKRK